jgi:hypothetical protein
MRYKDNLIAVTDSPFADPGSPAELPRLQALGWLFIKAYEGLGGSVETAKIWHKPAIYLVISLDAAESIKPWFIAHIGPPSPCLASDCSLNESCFCNATHDQNPASCHGISSMSLRNQESAF